MNRIEKHSFIIYSLLIFLFVVFCDNTIFADQIKWVSFQELSLSDQKALKAYYKEMDLLAEKAAKAHQKMMTPAQKEAAEKFKKNLKTKNIQEIEFSQDPEKYADIGLVNLDSYVGNKSSEENEFIIVWNDTKSGRCGSAGCGNDVLRKNPGSSSTKFIELLSITGSDMKEAIQVEGDYNGMKEFLSGRQRYRWNGKQYEKVYTTYSQWLKMDNGGKFKTLTDWYPINVGPEIISKITACTDEIVNKEATQYPPITPTKIMEDIEFWKSKGFTDDQAQGAAMRSIEAYRREFRNFENKNIETTFAICDKFFNR